MPTVFVTRRAHFNAAHRLHNPEMSDEWNARTYGKCNSPNWHGHNYVLEVTVRGEPDPSSGYVVDLGALQQVVDERISDRCDHRNLNLEVDFLQGIIPSTENLVIAFWKELEGAIPAGQLYSLRLYETERNWAEYRRE